MQDFTFGIIETLHKEKKKRGKFPDHVSKNEVLHFIKNKVERSLKALEEEGKVNSIDAWNYNNKYYDITEDTEGSDRD